MANNPPTTSTYHSPNPSHITTVYRQNVSNFLFYSAASLEQELPEPSVANGNDSGLTSWIGDSARSLALRAALPLNADDGDATDAVLQNDKKQKKKKKSSAIKDGKMSAEDIVRDLPSNWSDFICMSCGTFLFPPIPPVTPTDNGKDNNKKDSLADASSNLPLSILPSSEMLPLPGNIFVRPLKRGRTRRRRASRAKAKQLHDRALSLQRRGGTSNNSNLAQIRKEALAKEKMQKFASSYRLGDGTAKNCLVMECTYCGTKRRRKGMEVRSDATKKKKDPKREEGGKVKASSKIVDEGTASQRQRQGGRSTNITTQIRDNSDFISLGSIGSGGRSNKSNGRGAHPMKRKQPESEGFPLLDSGKKKKKKKKKSVETKKGGLDAFLSSLND